MFAQVLRDSGLTVNYEPPMERRDGGGEALVHVVYWIADNAGAGLIGGATFAAAAKAVAKLRERFPKAVVNLDEEE
jgi:hypothetical protein